MDNKNLSWIILNEKDDILNMLNSLDNQTNTGIVYKLKF